MEDRRPSTDSELSQYKMDLKQYSVNPKKAQEARQNYKIEVHDYSVEKVAPKKSKVTEPQPGENYQPLIKRKEPSAMTQGSANDQANIGVWVRYLDESSGLTYLYNEATGESKWESEPDPNSEAVEQQQGTWVQTFDDDGNAYFYNQVTGVSAWELPPGESLAGGAETSRSESRVKFLDDGISTGRSSVSKSAPINSQRSTAADAAAAAAAALQQGSLGSEDYDDGKPRRRLSAFQAARLATAAKVYEPSSDAGVSTDYTTSARNTPSPDKQMRVRLEDFVDELSESEDVLPGTMVKSPENLNLLSNDPSRSGLSSRTGRKLLIDVNSPIETDRSGRSAKGYVSMALGADGAQGAVLEGVEAAAASTSGRSNTVYPILQRSPGGTLYRYFDENTGLPYVYDPATGLSEWEETDKTAVMRNIVDAIPGNDPNEAVAQVISQSHYGIASAAVEDYNGFTTGNESSRKSNANVEERGVGAEFISPLTTKSRKQGAGNGRSFFESPDPGSDPQGTRRPMSASKSQGSGSRKGKKTSAGGYVDVPFVSSASEAEGEDSDAEGDNDLGGDDDQEDDEDYDDFDSRDGVGDGRPFRTYRERLLRKQQDKDSFGRSSNRSAASAQEEINYEKVYPRSIVLRQRWPWVMLIDMKSDRKFYMNEISKTFQQDAPKEFFQSVKDYHGFTEDLQRNHYHKNIGYRAKQSQSESSEVPSKQALTTPAMEASNRPPSTSASRPQSASAAATNRSNSKWPWHNRDETVQLDEESSNVPASASGLDAAAPASERSAGAAPRRSAPIDFEREYAPPRGIDQHILGALFNEIKESVDKSTSNQTSDQLAGIARVTRRVDDALKLQSRLRVLAIGDKRCETIDRFLNMPPPQRRTVKPVVSTIRRMRSAGTGNGTGNGSTRTSVFDEEERLAAQRTIIVNELKSQAAVARNVLEAINGLLDESEETWIERETNRRYILEAAVMQRGYLVMPRSSREAVAYPSMSDRNACPMGIGMKNTHAGGLASRHFIETKRRGCWSVYVDTDRILPDVYFNNITKTIQFGEPFDVKCHRVKRSLKREKWSIYERQMSWRTGGQPSDKVRNLHLLSDEFGGFIYYCPRRDIYSYDGSFGEATSSATVIDDLNMNMDAEGQGEGQRGSNNPNPTITTPRAMRVTISTPSKSDPQSGGYGDSGERRKTAGNTSTRNGMAVDDNDDEGGPKNAATLSNTWLDISPTIPHRISAINAKRHQLAQDQRWQNKFLSAAKKLSVTSPPPLSRESFDSPSRLAFTAPSALQTPQSLFKLGSPSKNKNNLFAPTSAISDDMSPSQMKEPLPPLEIDDGAPLRFECCFSDEEYNTYKGFIERIVAQPSSIVGYLELVYWFIEIGLGVEAFAVLQYALELLAEWSPRQQGIDIAISKMLLIKMSQRYLGNFESLNSVAEVLKNAPEHSGVLAIAAGYLRKIDFTNEAEQLYIGSLLMNPLNAQALRGYSQLLAEKGMYHTAHRYIQRVPAIDMEYPLSRTELAWLHELKGIPSDATRAAFKLAAGTGDRQLRSVSLALHSLGHFHHVRGEVSAALKFYDRSLLCCTDNAAGLVLRSFLMETTNTSMSAFVPSFLMKTDSSSSPTSSGKEDDKMLFGNTKIGTVPDSNKCLPGITAADASFRKGVAYLHGSSRWIALLAHAEGLISHHSDLEQAESLLWEAARTGSHESVWPVIALGQFYQYIRGDVRKAKSVLKRFLHKRVRTSLGVSGNRIAQGRRLTGDTEFDFNLFLDDNDDLLANGPENHQGPPGPHSNISVVQAESAALYSALAYCLMDNMEFVAAAMCAKKALRIDNKYSPAHRCLALLAFNSTDIDPTQHVEAAHGSISGEAMLSGARKKREQQLELANAHFFESNKNAHGNPYSLRSYSLYCALTHRYTDALTTITSKVSAGSNHPLSWRALGVMTYLFHSQEDAAIAAAGGTTKKRAKAEVNAATKKRTELAISYLKRAFDLTGFGDVGDVDAAILCGQLLLEVGRHTEALACFRAAMKISPSNPILIASLALAISAAPQPDGSRSSPAKAKLSNRLNSTVPGAYASRLRSLNNLSELGQCKDADELFHAAMTENLEHLVRQNVAYRQSFVEHTQRAKELDVSPREHEIPYIQTSAFDAQGSMGSSSAAASSSHTAIPPDVYYWYAMYNLRQGSAVNMETAEKMFHKAINSSRQSNNGTPHPLAMYMLGWLEELRGDFRAAEKLYSYALQIDPIDPVQFLRLKLKGKKKKRKGKKAAGKVDLLAGLSGSESGRNKISNDGVEVDDDVEIFVDSTGLLTIAGSSMSVMQTRILLHEKVHKLANMRKAQLGGVLQGLHCPGRLVYIESYWLDRLMDAFSQCDDWACLLKSGADFKHTTAQKAAAAAAYAAAMKRQQQQQKQ